MNNSLPILKTMSMTLLFCLIAITGRIIPHPYNMTPFLALLIISHQYLPRHHVILCSLLALFLSDCLLALWQPHPLFGSWAIFTYSGWLMIAWFTQRLTANKSFPLTWVGIASIGFWIWTNFGTWLCGALYSKTTIGLIECYTLALPFLERSLIGDLLWFTILSTALQGYQRYRPINIPQ